MPLEMYGFGASWVGPGQRWVGPGGQWVGPTAARDISLSIAIGKLGHALRNATRKPDDSPTTAPAWTGGDPPRLAMTTQDVASQSSLFGYDAQVLHQVVTQQVLGQARLSAEAAIAKVSTIGDKVVSALQRPSVKMLEAEFALTDKAAGRRTEQLEELFTQAGSASIFFATLAGIADDSHPYTAQFLNVATEALGHFVHGIKHAFAVPRPWKGKSALAPIVAMPSHASFPSGHASYAYMTAELLSALSPSANRDVLLEVAKYIADNRVVAGVHFPVDSVGGEVLGRGVAAWLAALGSTNPNPATWTGTRYVVDVSKEGGVNPQAGTGARHAVAVAASDAGTAPAWQWLAHRARLEWM